MFNTKFQKKKRSTFKRLNESKDRRFGGFRKQNLKTVLYHIRVNLMPTYEFVMGFL